MTDLLLWLGLFLVAVAALSWSLFSILAPRKLRGFMEWYTRANTWSAPKPSPRSEGFVSQRIAGFFGILMSILMLRIAVSGLLRAVSVAPVVRSNPSELPDHHWPALIWGVAIIGFGVYVAIRPQLLLRFTEKNFPNRELSPRLIRQALRAGPVVGTLTILLGAYLLFLWYRWTH